MIFDKNQKTFPSDFQREVWWWAVGLVPPNVSLTDEVKKKCGNDVLEGCYQWYEYFNALCTDMYNHPEAYAPASARQYRDILESITANGKLHGNVIVWSYDGWKSYADRIDKGKAYASSGTTTAGCLTALARSGIECAYRNDAVIFSNAKYPKIFHAMHVMEHSPNIRKTPARHHFAHCEYRQLFKSYSANYDELLRRVSDESLYVAHAIHDFAKSLKVQRYIHFDTIKYKYNNIRVLDFTICGTEYPTLRVNIGTCANPDADVSNDGFYKHLSTADSRIQDKFIRHLVCGDVCNNYQTVLINGKEESLTPMAKIKINPLKEDLDAVLHFIAGRKHSIECL